MAAKGTASLRAEVEKLAAQVAALESKLAAAAEEEPAAEAAPASAPAAGLPTGAPAAGLPTGAAPSIGDLMASLAALTAAATEDAGTAAPTSARVIGSGVAKRPATAPYRHIALPTTWPTTPCRFIGRWAEVRVSSRRSFLSTDAASLEEGYPLEGRPCCSHPLACMTSSLAPSCGRAQSPCASCQSSHRAAHCYGACQRSFACQL